jgi:hypothetical protein
MVCAATIASNNCMVFCGSIGRREGPGMQDSIRSHLRPGSSSVTYSARSVLHSGYFRALRRRYQGLGPGACQACISEEDTGPADLLRNYTCGGCTHDLDLRKSFIRQTGSRQSGPGRVCICLSPCSRSKHGRSGKAYWMAHEHAGFDWCMRRIE